MGAAEWETGARLLMGGTTGAEGVQCPQDPISHRLGTLQ